MSYMPTTSINVNDYARTFTPDVVARERLNARSVTLAYFGHNLARQLGKTPAELRRDLQDLPYLSFLKETPLGNAAVVTLPMTLTEMIRDPELARRYGRAALELAAGMGAGHVSLGAFLPSALRDGQLLGAQDGVLTAHHATTAAAILKTVEAVLLACDRTWRSERVALLGAAGLLGKATLSASLARLGRPRNLVLADLRAKQDETLRFAAEIRVDHPDLDVSCIHLTHRQDGPLYGATLVISFINTPNALRVEDLQPGTMVVDDSVPHCFDVERAFTRIGSSGDLVLARGGTLRFASEYASHAFAPPLFHTRLGWEVGVQWIKDITSCTLSPLLVAQEPSLSATAGQDATAPTVLAHYRVLDRHSITAPLICSRRSPSPAYLAEFARRFGAR